MTDMDLYTRDRMERNAVDYDGSGIGSGRFTTEKERLAAKITQIIFPIVLSVFMLLGLGVSLYMHISEINLKANGIKVMASYNAAEKSAAFKTIEGDTVKVDAQMAFFADDSTKVPVYYYENRYDTTQVITSSIIWFAAYIVLGGAFIGCILWIYKEMHETKHAQTVKSTGKFDD